MRSRRSVLWRISLGALILAAVGVGCFLFADKIVTLIAAKNLESIAAEVSTSTSIEALFEAMVGDMIARLRIVGVLLSGLGGLVLVGRRFIGAYLVDVAAAFSPFVRALYRKSTTWALTEDRLHLASLAAIGVLGVALRLLFLSQPMRYDEAYTYNNFASGPLYIGLARLPCQTTICFIPCWSTSPHGLARRNG